MRTLGVLARKGGAGKTTLAVHLGVLAEGRGLRTLLVDLDPQRSLAKWWGRRGAETPLLAEGGVERLPQLLEAAQGEGVDLVIVDTRPSVEGDAAAVARLVDFALVPTRPAILDLEAIGATLELLQALKRPAGVVLNAVPPPRAFLGEGGVVRDARRALHQLYPDIPLAPTAIGLRAALAYALVDGRAVTEFDPAGKASLEILDLWNWLEQTAWPPARRRPR